MKSLQRIARLFLLFALVVCVFDAEAKTTVSEKETDSVASGAVKKAPKKLPHFFPPGVIQTQDPVQQWTEVINYWNITVNCYRFMKNKTPVLDTSSIKVPVKLFGGDMLLVLDGYVRVDGKIRYTSLCEQGFITEEELTTLADFLVFQTERSINDLWDYYKDVREDAISIRAATLKMSERDFREMLPKTLPDEQGVTFADLNFIPGEYQKKDFLPRELHLGFTPDSVWALAFINGGIVFYNHGAVIKDYVLGKPETLPHELIHRNLKLQNLILSLGFDAEAMASIPALLYSEDKTSFFLHSYTSVFRELAFVFFRFDVDQARKDVVLYNYPLKIDEKKFRAYTAQIEEIKQELRHFFRKKTLPAFYADPIWWSAAHERMKDKHLVLRVTMAQYYNQTLLGGKNETRRWLDEHQVLITKFAHEAYRKSGEASQHSDVMIIGGIRSVLSFLGIHMPETEDERVQAIAHEFVKKNKSTNGEAPHAIIEYWEHLFSDANKERAAR